MSLIKQIKPEDFQNCFILDSESINLWTLKQWESELSKDTLIAFAIVNEYKIIGVCISQILFNQAELNYLALHPHFKRKGYGKALMNALISKCIKSKVKKIILEVSVKNISAISLYDYLGFETTGIRRNYYKDGSDALLKEKKLFKKI